MCGLAGFIDYRNPIAAGERRRILARMGQRLARRGPDDEQFYDDGVLSLVFRRLAIIDPGTGRQPIWNEDESILVAVNGEIYNHRELRARLAGGHAFRTRSDSEVVLHLYEELGEECLRELNGMFAILVWDRRRQKLLLARDRLGIKPLYYAHVDGALLFASELKALLAHPRCPRTLNWSDIGRPGKQPGRTPSFVTGVHHLPGGEYLACSRERGPATAPYWRLADHLPGVDEDRTTEPEICIERYGELLEDSVRRQLMSDVPVGLFLSGGVDSCLLAAIAAAHQPNLHCFTVVERTTVRVGDVEQAARTADRLGLPFHAVIYDRDTLLDTLGFDLQHFEYLVWMMESPRFEMEWLLKHELHRYAKTAVPGLKVILLGQGADEFAGGYSSPLHSQRADWDRYLGHLYRKQRWPEWSAAGIPERYFRLLADDGPANPATAGQDPYHLEMLSSARFLQRYNLWHEDRTSAIQGIESRVPFLDHRLVELLAGIPARLHPRLFFDKRIVREQLARRLPDYPVERRKVNFYRTGAVSSVDLMAARILRRIYPHFREKYLEGADALFAATPLDQLFERGVQGRHIDMYAVSHLYEAMALAVFRDGVLGPPDTAVPSVMDAPSPLRGADGETLQGILREWSLPPQPGAGNGPAG
ncbi:asparagine synthase (glutamine-hydrolyzing) [Thioalbus denitrificans]|uniref:asparagine synthase (glutamine-hydrolyzing) n=1 Tax=Thioalbus denitrificans TaxID=547122 RepID=A0A369CAY1_9GAMM|nr:asparagine synthase (glutamine-hydrolyzing) [Thioalbus denitrificans]RCX30348.1 asparagine synthase (glutamine-hydrolysing) [Thioalbus denitrificans]